MEKLLLRPEEVALILGVGRSRVYQLLASGSLPNVRVGNTVRVPVDALKLWIEKRTRPAKVPAGARAE